MPLIGLFLARYKAVPCVLQPLSAISTKYLHATSVTNYIRDELKHDLETDHIMTTYNNELDELFIISRCSDLGNGVVIDMGDIRLDSNVLNPNKFKPDQSEDLFSIISKLSIYFLPQNRSYVQNIAKHICKMTLNPIEPSKSFTLHMICKNINGYYLTYINIKKPLITDLALHYGKNFVSIHERIIKTLNKKDEKGIVFLHGIPGSGKFLKKKISFLFDSFFFE